MTPHNTATDGIRFLVGSLGAVLATVACLSVGLPQPAQAFTAGAEAVSRADNGLDVRAFGAACDGVTDDRAALEAALGALSSAGGGVLRVPEGTCRVVQTASSVFSGVPSNVTIQGAGKASRIALDCDPAAAGYVELFRVAGQNIAIRDLQLVRTGACNSILIAVHSIRGLELNGVTLLGNAKRFDEYVHGVMLMGVEGPSSDLTLDHVSMSDLDYGLFQPSSVTQPVTGITVTHSRFTKNYADDLEFNAPEGLIQDVTVTKSVFRNNKSTSEGAGFGIGLANVHNVLIKSNKFARYAFEPIHIEDRSTNVLVKRNRFQSSFTMRRNWASHVFIVNASHNVNVVNNFFDTRTNCNAIQAVFVNPGGSNLKAPTAVTVRGNTLLASKTARLAYHSGVAVQINGNTVKPQGRC